MNDTANNSVEGSKLCQHGYFGHCGACEAEKAQQHQYQQRNCTHGVPYYKYCARCIDDACRARAAETVRKYAEGGKAAREKANITDHAEATAEMLERVVKQLRNGVVPEDLGAQVVLIGRMMERRT